MMKKLRRVHEILEKEPWQEPRTPSEWDEFFGWENDLHVPSENATQKAVDSGLIPIEPDGTVLPASLAMLGAAVPRDEIPYPPRGAYREIENGQFQERRWRYEMNGPWTPEPYRKTLIPEFYESAKSEYAGLLKGLGAEHAVALAKRRFDFARLLRTLCRIQDLYDHLSRLHEIERISKPESMKRWIISGLTFGWVDWKSEYAVTVKTRLEHQDAIRTVCETFFGGKSVTWPYTFDKLYPERWAHTLDLANIAHWREWPIIALSETESLLDGILPAKAKAKAPAKV
jgi:hypothetical protein